MKLLLPLLFGSWLGACVSFELVTPPKDLGDANTCSSKSCEELGAVCGRVSDGCDGSQLCGLCSAPQTCTSGSCTANGKALAAPVLLAPATTTTPQSTVTGTTEPLVTVRIFADAICVGEPLLTTTASATGTFSVMLTLTDAAHILYADAQDAERGNASACSAPVVHNRSALQISQPLGSFGSVLLGQASSATQITITNGGAVATSALSVQLVGDSADFTVSGNCVGVPLAPNASCGITLNATPVTAGPKSLALTVAGQPGGSVTFTASATGRARLIVVVHELQPANGRVVASDNSLDCANGVCFADYPGGTVTIAASAQAGLFSGWLGDCSGVASGCMVSMNVNRTVHASFAMANIAFYSSRAYKMPLAASAAAAHIKADDECTQMARAVGLPGTFVAWLSTSTQDAHSKLGTASGWISVTGKTIALSQADLLATRLSYSLVFDEHGTYGAYYLLTGSNSGGLVGSGNCADFSSTSGSDLTLGLTTSSVNWTTLSATIECDPTAFRWVNDLVRLACFQTDLSAGAPAPSDVGRRAFVTSSSFAPGYVAVVSALADADLKCQTDAAALPGGAGGATFTALLATSTETAASRLTVSAIPWVRPDGVLLAPTPSSFLQRTQLWSAPRLLADGSFTDAVTYTGTTVGNAVALAADTCMDWTSASNANSGKAWNLGLNDALQTDNVACDQALPLLCLED